MKLVLMIHGFRGSWCSSRSALRVIPNRGSVSVWDPCFLGHAVMCDEREAFFEFCSHCCPPHPKMQVTRVKCGVSVDIYPSGINTFSV